MLGSDRGRAGRAPLPSLDLVRVAQGSPGPLDLSIPGGPARVVVSETITTVVRTTSREVRRSSTLQQLPDPYPTATDAGRGSWDMSLRRQPGDACMTGDAALKHIIW